MEGRMSISMRCLGKGNFKVLDYEVFKIVIR
jgi:hypothetical protein